MKRLVLCALAVLLTSGALISSRPAFACTTNPRCGDDSDCAAKTCAAGHHAICNSCTGTCLCS